MRRGRIAIVGTGIAGLSCAHFLRRDYDLTLFEKDDRIGGHSHTVLVNEGHQVIPIDTGFMVYNEVTYPLLTRLFRELNVATKPTSMSFSVNHVADRLEFNGGSVNLLFGQRKNLFSLRYWRMLGQIARFNRETIEELANPVFGDISLMEYVIARGYGNDFLDWYLSPMAAAVWSSPPERIKMFPAKTLMRFWLGHPAPVANGFGRFEMLRGKVKSTILRLYPSRCAGEVGDSFREGISPDAGRWKASRVRSCGDRRTW